MRKISRYQRIIAFTATAVVLFAVIIFLLGCAREGIQPPPVSTIPNSNSGTTSGRVVAEDNYIILESTGMDTTLLSIEGVGRVEFVHFAGGKILEYKTGNISQERVRQLANEIDEKGFFEMDSLYTGKTMEQGGPVPDIQTTSISVAMQGKTHTVFVTSNADDFPVEFTQIVKELMKLVPTLEAQASGVYIKAKKMGSKDVEVLKRNKVEIHEFTEEQLASLPVLQKAILEPGRLVYVNEDQEEKILQYEIKIGFFHNHFYINHDNHYYDVFVLDPPRKVTG